MTIAAKKNLNIGFFYVKTVYLHGRLKETVCVCIYIYIYMYVNRLF